MTNDTWLSVRVEAINELEHHRSKRLRLLGSHRKSQIATIFVDCMDAGYDKERTKREMVEFLPPGVYIFFLSILWDVLWAWWQKRHPQPAPTPTIEDDTQFGSVL